MEPSLVKEWFRSLIEKEAYWFQKIELAPDLITPGWSDGEKDKLPYFGLPENMHGMRVLDVGCAEGFFSFEAERRGAREVIAIDPVPGSIRRLQICRDYFKSRVTGLACSVYDLNPKTFGTFDMVFFFGVLYHLRHPLLALEKILSISTGTLLMQTYSLDAADPALATMSELKTVSLAKFHPFGMKSGPNKDMDDPSVLWVPNTECARAMLLSTGFRDVEMISDFPDPLVFRAQSPTQSPGQPPDFNKIPWS